MVKETTQKQTKPETNAQETRALDPNVSQRTAASPEHSSWVSASAGSGKTKVLTDRVLRLLLPRKDGRPGSDVQKILCLTFTKAGASQMAIRVSSILSRWAVEKEADLKGDLKKLLGREATPYEIKTARRLFANVVDAPGGLKIMTIHSFCQSVLGRFPLEAMLHPHFKVMEDGTAREMMAQARDSVLRKAQNDKGSPLHTALTRIAQTVNEEQFFSLLGAMAGEQHQMETILERRFGAEGLYTGLCEKMDVPPGLSPEDLLIESCRDDAFDKDALTQAAKILSGSSGKTDQENAATIGSWLTAIPETRAQNFKDYAAVFLTQKNEISKRLVSKKMHEKHPDIAASLEQEAARILLIRDRQNAALCAQMTHDLFLLGHEIIKAYSRAKKEQAFLDYNDLIFTTLKLLKGEIRPVDAENTAAWVLYKLDQGIEHILVDEAQDTNPEQWNIIESLCSEFFAGQGITENTRTLFSVGDQKQSIYSFQRASPQEFSRMKSFVAAKVSEAGQDFKDVPMNISFRSAKSVLDAVDATFREPNVQKGLSDQDIKHHSFRTGQAGRVELWPLFESEKPEDFDAWSPPVQIRETVSGAARLAEHIAQTVQQWIREKEILPAHGRAIKPGDIMILVRTRNAFVYRIARALKARNIPVSGIDRMILSEELVIEDLLAFAQFGLLPEDDLTLACVLKSPLIGLEEEALYALAVDRKGSLWESLRNSAHTEIYDYLDALEKDARTLKPFEFFSQLLQKPCPADPAGSGLRTIKKRLGEEAVDPVHEFLELALDFESTHIASLQKFLQWQAGEKIEIKRELEEHGNHVRIMTVHGAKGLEAPIVIMPDTLRTTLRPPGQSDKRLLWPDKTGLELPLWSPHKDTDCLYYTRAMEALDERLEEEYRRLLYVGMTRAEDRLYIAGHKMQREPLEKSWYFYVKKGLESCEETKVLDDGTLRLENPQTRPAPEIKTKEDTATTGPVPAWLYKAAPEEPDPPAPLVPSRPAEDEAAVLSPLETDAQHRFRRGNLTHKLLEFLPDVASENREEIAKTYLEKYAGDMPEDFRHDILNETLAVLNHEIFAPVFGPGSLAEVPVTGLMPDGRVVSGQIDRLLVTEEAIWIIDYKTNRPPPENPEDVPEIYKKQMKAYADTLQALYEGRTIYTALLWTNAPYIMHLNIKNM